jgi:hypothetical protein
MHRWILSKHLHLNEKRSGEGSAGRCPDLRKPATPFRYSNSSPEIIRPVVIMYAWFPLSLRNVEDLLFERRIDICHGHCQSKCTAGVMAGAG